MAPQPDAQPLTPRQETLLLAVCRDYVTTGQEVSSAGLIRMHGLPWSSATVRQELATLERRGYLHRSHHSSGRLPTRAGMELYVARLPDGGPVAPHLAAAVDLSLGEYGADTERLRAASRVLSEAAGCVAVSFLGSARVGRISEIEVVPFLGARALVVLSFDDGSTLMRPVQLDGLAAPDEGAGQRRLREQLRRVCVGRTLADARAELLRRKGEEEARFDHIFAEALRVGLILCAGAALDPLWLHVAGQPSLARALPSEAGAHLGDVLELLEDFRRLADVLCQLLPSDEDEDALRARVSLGVPLTVGPGGEENEDGLTLTVVGCRLPLPDPDSSTGAVALLGSDRMDYASVIPLVEYAARTLAAHTGA